MMKKCPVCKGNFCVIWPQQWAYKRGTKVGEKYFCSWTCLRASETPKKEEVEYEMGMKARANRLETAKALIGHLKDGGNPHEYLRKAGYTDPASSLWSIKNYCKEEHPGVFRDLQALLDARTKATFATRNNPAQEVQQVKEAAAAVPELTEEKTEPIIPLQFEGFTVRCIENESGRFFYDAVHNTLDWTRPMPDGEEISLSPAAWVKLATETLPKVMAILGVEV